MRCSPASGAIVAYGPGSGLTDLHGQKSSDIVKHNTRELVPQYVLFGINDSSSPVRLCSSSLLDQFAMQ